MDSAAEHNGPTDTSSPMDTVVVWKASATRPVTGANEIHSTWLAATRAT
jgi:hypothetical protein